MAKFPKSVRLLKKSDFRFRPYQKYLSERFSFFYKKKGSGRMGISISKKVLKKATDRNRIKRLLRESYREMREKIPEVDVHVVAREGELQRWDKLKKKDIFRELENWIHEIQGHRE